MVQNINRLLAESLGPLNAVLAVVFLLLGLSAGLAATAGLRTRRPDRRGRSHRGGFCPLEV